MENAHRTNVLVTSCLKTPVDPHTKAPLASYERERVLILQEQILGDSGEEKLSFNKQKPGEYLGKGSPVKINDLPASRDRFNLSEIFFSNEEYYSKLEELKKAHLRTMAELESMYRRKLELKTVEPSDMTNLEARQR
uniref:Uncharacterized protein n=1 Tax=Sphaeramia orbicularis TaxID=375764 RepID=A0A672YZV2_9TELE